MRELRSTGIGAAVAAPQLKLLGAKQTPKAEVTLVFNGFRRNSTDPSKYDKRTAFVRCDAWGTLAQYLADNVEKGTAVFVDGWYESVSWESYGRKQTMLVLHLDAAQVCVTRRRNGAPVASASPAQPAEAMPPMDESDIPF